MARIPPEIVDLVARVRAWLSSLLTPPAFPEDEDKTQASGLLNTTLLLLLAALLPYAVAAPFLPNPAWSMPIIGLVILFDLTSLFLLRIRRVWLACTLFSAGVWVAMVGVSIFFGGVNGAPFPSLIVVVVLGGLLLGRWGAFLFAALSVAAGVGMLLAADRGFLPPSLGTNPALTRLAANSVLIIIASFLVQVATGRLRSALHRLRHNGLSLAESNQELQSIRESLEQRDEQVRATVQQYADHMARVAQGDLTARLPIAQGEHKTTDALAALGRNLNETTASLHEMTQRIHDVASSLGTAAAEILAASTQQATGTSEQSAAVSQVSATIRQVRTIAQQTSQRAQEVAQVAQRAAEISRQGQQAAESTIQGMQEVRRRVEAISQDILALAAQANTIGTIVDSVGALASQSNMLALNASVEAARAGEAGRGFAVVAGEVRSLAGQSRGATQQVREVLTKIRNGVHASVSVTEEGIKGVDVGTDLAGEAGEAIRELAAEVEKSAGASAQIAAAAEQQLIGMEQIAAAIEGIHQVAAQSLASVRQTEEAAGRLNDLAGELTEAVERYRL